MELRGGNGKTWGILSPVSPQQSRRNLQEMLGLGSYCVVQQLWVQILTPPQACDVPVSPEFKDPMGLTFQTASLCLGH